MSGQDQRPLLLSAMQTRGVGGMLPQKIFEILGVNTCTDSKFIVDVKNLLVLVLMFM